MSEDSYSYYAILNLPHNASIEQIKSSYKRWVLLLHPDKHFHSSSQFQRITEAYNVLIDPKLRSKYQKYGDVIPFKELKQHDFEDNHGTIQIDLSTSGEIKGGHVDYGWDFGDPIKGFSISSQSSLGLQPYSIVSLGGRYKLNDYYQTRLLANFGSMSMVQAVVIRSISNGSVFTVGTFTSKSATASIYVSRMVSKNSNATLSYTLDSSSAPTNLSCCGLSLSHHRNDLVLKSDFKIGNKNTAILNFKKNISEYLIKGTVGLKDSIGMMIGLFIQRTFNVSKYTVGMEINVAQGLSLIFKYSRRPRKLIIPIHFTSNFDLDYISYLVLLPGLITLVAERFIFTPLETLQLRNKNKEQFDQYEEDLSRKKQESKGNFIDFGMKIEAQEMMREQVKKRRAIEIDKKGLVIVEAQYGELSQSAVLFPSNSSNYIDVTLPIQALVDQSSLYISGGHSKQNMIGFYDPCFMKQKSLLIVYRFMDKLHRVVVDDYEPLKIPLKDHRLE